MVVSHDELIHVCDEKLMQQKIFAVMTKLILQCSPNTLLACCRTYVYII